MMQLLKPSTRMAFATSLVVFSCVSSAAQAHFQELIPTTNVIDQETGKDVHFDMVFTHPTDMGPTMEMAYPVQFGMQVNGQKTDLLDKLTRHDVDGKQAYQADVILPRPAGYVFYIEPEPYYEPAEGKYIVQYTKTVIDAFGDGSNWDQMVGFPVEIEPLSRPYGLWAGNSFSGIVKHNGKPVPFAEIEVEFRNDGSVKLPNGSFSTQIIKADANGTFSYTTPWAGWWVFAALIEDGTLPTPDGKANAPVERGGVLWIKTDNPAQTSN
jgi:cobalt/nickel transport protein